MHARVHYVDPLVLRPLLREGRERKGRRRDGRTVREIEEERKRK